MKTQTSCTSIESDQCLCYLHFAKFLEARKFSCNQPKIQTNRPNYRVICPKDANGKANSEDPDQTAPGGGTVYVLCQV